VRTEAKNEVKTPGQLAGMLLGYGAKLGIATAITWVAWNDVIAGTLSVPRITPWQAFELLIACEVLFSRGG
jgi:hypothetical protein